MSRYSIRRDLLRKTVLQQYGDNGIILLFANLDQEHKTFRQESSFYYLTGLFEPGLALVIDMQGRSTIYQPVYGTSRALWTGGIDLVSVDSLKSSAIDLLPLGDAMPGYQTSILFNELEYKHLLQKCLEVVQSGGYIATANPAHRNAYIEQQLILGRLSLYEPLLTEKLIDVSPQLAVMRRTKDESECGDIIEAVEITMQAHRTAAREIQAGVSEKTIQMLIEYEMHEGLAQPAFPSIVASGVHGTTLHYTRNDAILRDGDLLVVDIGAEYQHYCADITRTYPISGAFSPRQKEVYMIVLETQRYVESKARPGVWLNNKEKPDQSLHHLAKEFLRKKGYDTYFPHGIGHYLGLDTHDVGDYTVPLQEGDVITIEPGIYIPQEKMGIRIEDDYLLTKTGVICLSEELPKDPDDIVRMMKS